MSVSTPRAARPSTKAARRGGRPTLYQSEELTDRILEVAERQFKERGFLDTNFDRIAAEANTTKSALYKRFEHKAALFVAVGQHVLKRHFRYDLESMDEGLPLLDGLRALAMALIDAATAPESIALYSMLSQGASFIPEIAAIIKKETEFYDLQTANFFKQKVDRGLLALKDYRATAAIFLSLIFSKIESALARYAPLPTREESVRFVDDITLVFLGGVARLELECRS